MTSELEWIKWWNIIIMIFALIYAFIAPYCLAFAQSSKLEIYICDATKAFEYLNLIMYIADVFVEIIGACPVAGSS